MGRETQKTKYNGELVRVGRFSVAFRNGELIAVDTLGYRPTFHRPKSSPGTIAIQAEPGSENLDINA